MTYQDQHQQIIRQSILRLALGDRLTTALLLVYLQNEGFNRLEKDELLVQIRYLEDKGCLKSETKLISPEIREWRTTAAGMDYLASLRPQ